jgi:uncharacterized membrane protein
MEITPHPSFPISISISISIGLFLIVFPFLVSLFVVFVARWEKGERRSFARRE